MPKQHTNNSSYCGLCQTWVVGLTQHNTRSKTHLRKYEPIRQRLVAQRAAQRAAKQGGAINNDAGETSAPPISDDDEQRQRKNL